MKKAKRHFIVKGDSDFHNTSKEMLCKDGKFRSSPTFGTYKNCVKFYKGFGWAERKQLELLEFHNMVTTIITINNGDILHSSGRIERATK